MEKIYELTKIEGTYSKKKFLKHGKEFIPQNGL